MVYMTCFNDIAVGVTTDFEHADLETRFQMWGTYLWLSMYRIYVRLICEKQGDENYLKLPVSYHPYYTQQSFQVGKRKLDVCLSIGRNLTCPHVEQMRKQETILNEDAKVIACGLEEMSRTVVRGRFRKKEEQYDLKYYDAVLPTKPEMKKRIDELREEDTQMILNPYLLAESTHYGSAALPQTVSRGKPYILLYASKMDEATIEAARKMARGNEMRLAINEELKEYATQYTRMYSTESLERFYGNLMSAKHIITDSAVIAGLALERGIPFTALTAQNEELKDFVEKYNLQVTENFYPKSEEEQKKVKAAIPMAVRTLNRERYKSYRILESILGLVRFVDAPTELRMTNCYGCFVCQEVCPKGAITMEKNEEGFYYPKTDASLCVNCGICKKRCIANKKKQFARKRESVDQTRFPFAKIASCKSEEQREKSTSGGAFRSFVRYFIEEKQGVVFGAAFDEDARVVSIEAQTLEEAHRLSGSKYVKSEFAHMFPKVKEYLEAGREVLYSGLPCENAALRAYLNKEYDNLTQCEVLCHGGASPKIYEAYIKHIGRKLKAKVKAVNFRDKKISWRQSDFQLTFSFENREPFSVRGRHNNYMNAFLKNYIFRMSCYRCQYAGKNRVADVTIGDYHGPEEVAAEVYNLRGVSSIIINTEKGERLWEAVKDDFNYMDATTAQAYLKNHTRPSVLTEERALIMSRLDKEPINDLLAKFNQHDAGMESTEI